MKSLPLLLALALLPGAAFARENAAHDPRIDIPRLVNPDRGLRDDWQLQNRVALDELNRDVRRLRAEVSDLRDRRIRARFHETMRATDRLNADYASHRVVGAFVERQARALQGEVEAIRRDLRAR